MTLQQLEYYLRTLEHGSFSAAAEHLRLAQPSVSEQVRRLEGELGVKLFRRAGRGVVPTEAGLTLRDHAERVLAEVEATRGAVAEVRELRGGTATFGMMGTSRFYAVAEIVAEFRRRHPAVRVRVLGLNSSEVAEAVRNGEIEAGLIVLPVDDRGLDVRPIFRDEVLYASADPEALARPIDATTITERPLVLYEASYGTDDPMRRQLAELAQRSGRRLEPQIELEDVEAALELAARGLADTIVARGVLHGLGRRVPRRLGWRPFDEPIYDTFALVSRDGGKLSPASREFLQVARDRLEALGEALQERPPRTEAPG